MVERSENESHKPTPVTYNMQTRVPYEKSIKLVIMAAQEYFNSSANLTDSCIGLARYVQDHWKESVLVVWDSYLFCFFKFWLFIPNTYVLFFLH